jgi:hypothetical protein
MEKNDYGDTVLGVVTTEDIVEGRMVLLTSHSESYDFGSWGDLPGVKLPDTGAEAARARYCLTWAQDNRSLPLYQPHPDYQPYALRYGWDQAANAPFAATVYITRPGVQEGLTIPSGTPANAFGEGLYTVPSGAFVYSAEIEVPGNPLAVANTADDSASDAGKLKYSATNPVGEVYEYDSSTGKLTFKLRD